MGVTVFFLEKSDDLFIVIASESDDLFSLSSPRHSHLPTSSYQVFFLNSANKNNFRSGVTP